MADESVVALLAKENKNAVMLLNERRRALKWEERQVANGFEVLVTLDGETFRGQAQNKKAAKASAAKEAPVTHRSGMEQGMAFASPNKVTIPKRSQDFGKHQRNFASLEDASLALRYGDEEWEAHKGGNITRSGQVKGDRVVAKHTTAEEQAKLIADAQARKAELDAISAEDAALVERLLDMDKLTLAEAEAQKQALVERDAALAREAAADMLAAQHGSEDAAARDASIALALQEAERDRAKLTSMSQADADAALARKLMQEDAKAIATREAQAAADAKLAATIQEQGSPVKVLPPPPRGGAASANEGAALAESLLAATRSVPTADDSDDEDTEGEVDL